MKSKYHHHVLLILAASVTVVVMALFTYMYFSVEKSAERAVLARDIAGVEKLNKEQERSLTDLYDRTKLDRVRLSDIFVHTDDVVSFIEALEGVETQAGAKIAISGISADDLEGKPFGTVGNVQASVEIRGSWSTVMKALSAIELLPYQISISELRLDTSALGAGKTKEWRLVFNIRAALINPPPIRTN